MKKYIYLVIGISLFAATSVYLGDMLQNYRASITSLEKNTEAVISEQVAEKNLKLDLEEGYNTYQEGGNFYTKIRIENLSNEFIKKGEFKIIVKNSNGMIIDSFGNGKDIDAGEYIISSINLPNIPNEYYFVECENNSCEPLKVEIPKKDDADNNSTLAEVDFAIENIYSVEESQKTKIAFEYSYNAENEIETDLAFMLVIKGENSEKYIGASTGVKNFVPGEIYEYNAVISGNPKKVEIEIDPNIKLNDSNRKNNKKEFQILASGDEENSDIDLKINKVTSKFVQHEEKEMIKLYVEIGQKGGTIVDVSGLDLEIKLPYSNEIVDLENQLEGVIDSSRVRSFVAYLPIKYQGHLLELKLDPKKELLDKNEENNFFIHNLPTQDTPYQNISINKTEYKIIDDADKRFLELNIDYSANKEVLNQGLSIVVTSLESGSVLFYEENIILGSVSDEESKNYSIKIDSYSKNETLKIELDPGKRFNDPVRADNIDYIRP